MSLEEIKTIINTYNKINVEEFAEIPELYNAISFIKEMDENYSDELKKYDESTVRFCDYYSYDIHESEIIDTFKSDYKREDIDEQFKLFLVHIILNNAKDIIDSMNDFTKEEIYDLLGQYIIDLNYVSVVLKQIKEEDHLLDFLTKNKYKVLFSGYSLEDINSLNLSVKKSLINIIKSKLSTEDVVPMAETIEYVKSMYGVKMMRVHLADDYRIAFMRKNDVTTILGVDLKTGKDSNYTRYSYVAKKMDEIDDEIKKLNENKLDKDSDHYKVVEIIKKVVFDELGSEENNKKM